MAHLDAAAGHPERLAEGLHNPEGDEDVGRRPYRPLQVDRFSHLVIFSAMQCLMVGGRSLWDRYDNGDNLLFCKEDFADPGASPLFRELWQLPTPFAHSLVGNLILACKEPMAQVPTVDALFSDENTVPARNFAIAAQLRACAICDFPGQ
jgi:hypothetical protein